MNKIYMLSEFDKEYNCYRIIGAVTDFKIAASWMQHKLNSNRKAEYVEVNNPELLNRIAKEYINDTK